jgi:hypothetical protein
MVKKLFVQIPHWHSLYQKYIQRQIERTKHFYLNPYLQNDIVRFRVKYSIPRGGFKIEEGERFNKWYKKLSIKYPSKKTYDYNRIIENKRFQNDLDAFGVNP